MPKFLTILLLLIVGALVLTAQQQNFPNGTAGGLPTGLTFAAPTFTVSTSGSGNGQLALSGNTSGTSTLTASAVAGTSTNPVTSSNVFALPNGTVTAPAYGYSAVGNWGMFRAPALNGLDWNMFTVTGNNDVGLSNGNVRVTANGAYGFSNSNTDASTAVTSAIARPIAGVIQIQAASAGRTGFLVSADSVFVTSNFTTSGVGTALENITGLTWTFPASAFNWNFHCHLAYHQNVGVAAVAFGIKATTNNPTNIMATGNMQTAATTFNGGVLPTLATQTATNIVTATPSVITTDWMTDLNGTMELPTSAVTINIMVSTATAGDTVTVDRGSYCAVTP